jgi:hypothetical protein
LLSLRIFEDEDALAVGAGGNQAPHDGLVEAILRGQRDDVAGPRDASRRPGLSKIRKPALSCC